MAPARAAMAGVSASNGRSRTHAAAAAPAAAAAAAAAGGGAYRAASPSASPTRDSSSAGRFGLQMTITAPHAVAAGSLAAYCITG